MNKSTRSDKWQQVSWFINPEAFPLTAAWESSSLGNLAGGRSKKLRYKQYWNNRFKEIHDINQTSPTCEYDNTFMAA